jgi:hypothetical protein
MDLAALVDREFVQPLKEAIVTDDLIATRQLINSVTLESNLTVNKDEVKVYAMDYVLELRDGEQYKSPPTLADIVEWVEAKGLAGTLEPEAVLNSILENGTIWDRQGGVQGLKAIINPENIQRIMNIAIDETIQELTHTQWTVR